MNRRFMLCSGSSNVSRKEAVTAAIRPVLLGFTLRTVTLWLITRAVFLTFTQGLESSLASVLPPASTVSHPLSVAPPTAVIIASVVTALVLNDVRVMRERSFLANIGVSLRAIATFAFGAAATLEIVVAMLLAATA